MLKPDPILRFTHSPTCSPRNLTMRAFHRFSCLLIATFLLAAWTGDSYRMLIKNLK